MQSFVRSLFEAAKIYFESKNITSLNLNTFVNVIKYSLSVGSVTSSQCVAKLLRMP